jgi:hypothetical protein
MDKIKFEYALSASIFSYRKYPKPYGDDFLFVDEEIESFLRGLQWDTELEEFKNVNKIVLRGKGNDKTLYIILRRHDKGFTLRRISRCIHSSINKEIIDITNISVQKYNDTLYLSYKILV